MGFMKPKAPKPPPPPPNPAITAIDAELPEEELSPMAGSLITTGMRGLRKRASTIRGSLLGGG